MSKATATDFLDPSVTMARMSAQQMGKLDEPYLTSHGAEKFANFVFTLDAEATLKSMERFVRPEALGKAFGDGAIFAMIPEKRVADVTLYKMEDGTGLSVAKIEDNSKAMQALFARMDISDLDLMPKAPTRKPEAQGAKQAKLSLADGTTLAVELSEAKSAPQEPEMRIPARALGGRMPVNPANPVALKEFLLTVSTQPVMAAPAEDARDLMMIAVMGATSEAHPQDKAWPAGVSVANGATGESIASPVKAFALFNAAFENRADAPVIDREELLDRFRAHRANAAGAAPEAPAARKPSM